MGRLSDASANNMLDMVFSKAANTAPTTHYIALSTTTPANDGTNVTEPVGGSYERVAKTNNNTTWPAASARSKSNGVAITFPVSTGDWGTPTHFAIYSAATNGTFIGWGAITSPVAIGVGSQASFDIGALVINAPGT